MGGCASRARSPSNVLVILRTGPNTAHSSAGSEALYNGHMANIRRLADEGKLVVAGPLGENAQHYQGIFVLNVASAAEARILLQPDPAIAAGIFEADVYGWYGSAALMQVPSLHRQLERPAQ